MAAVPLEPPFCTRLHKYGGYTSNMRGTLSYSSHMDSFDNPGMIPVLRNAYSLTTTKKDFLPKGLMTGKECLRNGIGVSDSGFTHDPPIPGISTSGIHSAEVAEKEQVNSSYITSKQLRSCCHLPDEIATETREAFSTDLLNLGKPAPAVKSILGNMESGFTRNFRPNPTDGRSLDPVYLGQYPAMGKFGPSVTHFDFVFNPYLTGKERNAPFSRETQKHSGFWQEKGLPPCYLKGTLKNICRPGQDYQTSYRNHYPRRWCDADYTGFKLTGKPITRPSILADMNLFEGKGYYVSETKERFSPILRNRVQQYPTCMDVKYTPSIFPKAPICTGEMKSNCPESSTWACSTGSRAACNKNLNCS